MESLIDESDVPGLENILAQQYNLKLNIQQWLDDEEKLYEEAIRERAVEAANDTSQKKE